MTRKIILLLLFLSVIGIVTRVQAAQFISQQSGRDTVSLTKPMNDTVVVIGNTIDISTQITGDVLAVSQTSVTITGTISNNAFIAANNVVLDGPIEGNVFVFAGTLTIGDRAVIGENVYAYSPQIIRKPGAVVNGPIITPNPSKRSLAERLSNHILATIALIVFGFVVSLFFPKTLKKMSDLAVEQWGATLLWGVVGFLVVPIVSGILIVTRIGLPLGLAILVLYLIDLYAPTIIVGATIGRLMTRNTFQLSWSMTIGILLIQILRFIPGIAGVVTFGVMIWGLGALLLGKKLLAHHFRHDL